MEVCKHGCPLADWPVLTVSRTPGWGVHLSHVCLCACVPVRFTQRKCTHTWSACAPGGSSASMPTSQQKRTHEKRPRTRDLCAPVRSIAEARTHVMWPACPRPLPCVPVGPGAPRCQALPAAAGLPAAHPRGGPESVHGRGRAAQPARPQAHSRVGWPCP